MNQKLWSGFTAATLLVITLGIAPFSYADPTRSDDEVAEEQVPAEEPSASQAASTSPTGDSETSQAESAPSTPEPEAVKVGEYQSDEQAAPAEAITELVPHQVNGRQAATLYVRNIPVLTFLGSSATSSTAPSSPSTSGRSDDSEVKVASVQNHSLPSSTTETPAANANLPAAGQRAETENAETANAENNPNDPVWRATEIAARLNQYDRDNVDASTITAAWDPQQQRYLIKVGDDELVAIDSATILPNSTNDQSQDVLQATNLLRRQLGPVPPIQSVSGDTQAGANQISLGPVQVSFSGMASWYGPGFDGNYSASGEVFNQNALTAAHRSLPFGTQVRVTNMDTGLSVVVRINDRGPFGEGRIIDLSTAAADAIGLISSGVAPVNLEVMGTAQTASD